MTKPHHLTPQSAQHFMDAAGLGESRFNPWVALRAVLLLALFILFGLVGVTFGEDSFLSGAALNAVRVCGLGLCGVALVVQPRRFRLGVSAMILGLVCLAVVGSGMAPLAFVLVLVETWAISTHARSHRGLWLGSIFLGSFAALTWWFVAVPLLLWEQPHWELWGWRMVILNAVFTVLLVVLSILVVWLWGRVELRKVQTMEVLAARAELAAVEERNRIAREMHDIVAHSLSGIIAQADGGRYAASQDPAAAIAALQTISKSGREALAQMRDVLSVLHDSDALGRTAADGDGVKPGVEQIPALINDATLAGLQIRFEETGAARPVGEVLGLTMFRVVQECITNVLKHAGQVETLVRIDWRDTMVRISVDNAPGEQEFQTIPGSGRGLVGIAQRARMHQGRSEGRAHWGESVRFPGGWGVMVELPL